MSSCNCHQVPCVCQFFPPGYGCPPPPCTKCDGPADRTKNVWVERGNNLGDNLVAGVCMLDTMTEEQIIAIIERDDQARVDLFSITTDARLHELARTIARLPTTSESDVVQNGLTPKGAPPFYALFRGQPPFAQ